MSQFGRPIADTANTNWQDGAAGTTDIYLEIDEVTPDGDFIRGPIDGSGNLYRCQLTSLSTPTAGTRTVRVRARTTSGAKTIDVYLYDDDGVTLIESWLAESVPNTSYTDIDMTVSNAITDYTDLHIRVTQSTETSRAIVDQVYLEIPDVASSAAPAAPTAASATADGDSITATFTDNSAGAQHRAYIKRTTDSVWNWAADLEAGVTTFTHEWLVADTSFDCGFTSFDADAESAMTTDSTTTGTVRLVSGSFL